MKNPNLGFVPTVIGFDKNNLKERIISIMKFKKPTTLTMTLSALLVLGISGTAAFAVAPKTEDPGTAPDPVVSTSEPTVTTSEPVSETNPADNNYEIGEPEPISSVDEPASKIPVDEHSIPIFPEDKNGIYYSESGDVIRVPIHLLNAEDPLPPSLLVFSIVKNDKGTIFLHALLDKEEGWSEYFYKIYSGDEFAVFTRNRSIWNEQIEIYRQMQYDGIIPYQNKCFHDLNSLE